MLRALKLSAMCVLLLFLTATALAHDMPTNTVINGFVKIEPDQAHLVVRVPLDLLRGLPLPVSSGIYDVKNAGAATDETVNALLAHLVLFEDGNRLKSSSATGRLSLPSDRSFEGYDAALAHASQPSDPQVAIYYDQGSFDAHFLYPIHSPKSVFKLENTVAADLGNAVKLTIRFLPLNESSRALFVEGGTGPIILSPAWYTAAQGFVVLGVEHILSGIDHLLFLFCLVLPFRGIRRLIPVVTAFTIAHSITLIGSAYHLAPTGAWFPPFVEAAIAASIVYMALENILGSNLRRRWLITGLFGLVHGFGFSYALGQQLQFAGSHLLVSLLSFNLGIECGQLFVLALILPLLALFRRAVPERSGLVVLSALAAHTAWHWMLDRWNVFWNTPWPRFDAAALVTLARWTAMILIVVGLVRVLANALASRRRQRLRHVTEIFID